MVTLIARDPCGVCGYRRPVVLVATVRVNKRSLRTTGTNLHAGNLWCPECGRTTGRATKLSYRLYPPDAERVRAYRTKRWPQLAGEVTAA